MSKYNLIDILNEGMMGGRAGTYLATLNQLEDTIKSLDSDENIEVKTLGMSGDGKTVFEYIVSIEGEEPFSIYPYKFDPEKEEDGALPFSVAGDINQAKKYIGMHGEGEILTNKEYQNFIPQMKNMDESVEDILAKQEPNMEELKKEISDHLNAYEEGVINGDDLAQAIGELIFGKVEAPGMEEEVEVTEEEVEEVTEEKEEIDEAMLPRPSLFKGTEEEIKVYHDSLKRELAKDKEEFKKNYMDFSDEDWKEDFENYVADKALQEHFGRFMKDYQ